MKMKIKSDYARIKAGTLVEIDGIRFDPECVGAFAVKVMGGWKKPRWLSISWFVETPKGVDWALRDTARKMKKGKS